MTEVRASRGDSVNRPEQKREERRMSFPHAFSGNPGVRIGAWEIGV